MSVPAHRVKGSVKRVAPAQQSYRAQDSSSSDSDEDDTALAVAALAAARKPASPRGSPGDVDSWKRVALSPEAAAREAWADGGAASGLLERMKEGGATASGLLKEGGAGLERMFSRGMKWLDEG